MLGIHAEHCQGIRRIRGDDDTMPRIVRELSAPVLSYEWSIEHESRRRNLV